MSNVTDRDLTPAEARAEIEAFMGRGWTCNVWQGVLGEYQCDATTGRIVIRGSGITYRAAVSALKSAWRDAVRPWCEKSATAYHDHRHSLHDEWALHGRPFNPSTFVRTHVLGEEA